jgi:hypothetical protein
MTRSEAKNILMKEFITEYASHTPVAYPNNEEFVKPTNAPWVRFLVEEITTKQNTIGKPGNRRYGRLGLIAYQVFIPNNTGTYEGDILCEKINNIFEGKRFGSINCWDGKYIPFGINAQDLYQFNGSISYTFDETK